MNLLGAVEQATERMTMAMETVQTDLQKRNEQPEEGEAVKRYRVPEEQQVARFRNLTDEDLWHIIDERGADDFINYVDSMMYLIEEGF